MERLTLGQTLTPIRKAVGVLFMGLVVVLMLLPFVTTFNELLTRIVEKVYLYQPIHNYFGRTPSAIFHDYAGVGNQHRVVIRVLVV